MSDAWQKVATGFKLVYYGLLLVVLAVVGGFLGMCLVGGMAGAAQNQQAAQGGLAMIVVIALGMGGLIILGTILGLVGRFFCMAVPASVGSAKGMIVTSVCLEVVSLLINVVNTADNAGGGFIPQGVKTVTGAGGSLFSIVAIILFLLYTRSVAEHIRKPVLAKQAMSVLWLWVGTFVCLLAGVGVAVAGAFAGGAAAGGNLKAGQGMAAGGGCAGLVLMLLALVLALIALIQYARLLTGMSEAVRLYADRGGSSDEYDDDYDDYDDRPRRRRRRDDDYDDDDE